MHRPPTEQRPGAERDRLVAYVLEAASIAGSASPISAEVVEQLDPPSLAAAATAADAVFLVASDDGRGAATFGADFMSGALEDAADDLRRVVEAGQRRRRERRAHGVHRAPTRIALDGLGRWTISRQIRPGQVHTRARERRPSARRRRGSRRATGTGSRAGPDGDPPDDPSDEPELARPGRVSRPAVFQGGAA